MNAAQAAGAGDHQADEYAAELGGFVLARSAVDRVTARRGDTEWVAAAWADPATRVLVLDNAKALVRFGEKGAELVLVRVPEAPGGLNFLLGVDDGGVAYFGVPGPPGCLDDLLRRITTPGAPATGTPVTGTAATGNPAEETPATGHPPAGIVTSGWVAHSDEGPAGEPPGPEQQTVAEQAARLNEDEPVIRPAGLREAAALLGDRDAGLFTHAVALANWHASHTHCPRCGTPTVPFAAGHAARCPNDGSEHFPRLDPAVIMLVTDPEGRCLLARNVRWPQRRVSILAGFVEPGESAEQAVAREVAEETSIAVSRVRYVGSQPWPMPQSLMLGFRAEAAGPLDLKADDEEIAEAHWYSREDLRAALAAKDVLLPPPVSIAHRLIEAWYGEELPGVW